MKLNAKALALMTALAAGLAGAQQVGDGTLSGTAITNTATATFTDPTLPSSSAPASVSSNTVTTTVLPKPGFDTVYRDGTDGAENSTTGGNTAASAKSTATLAPGGALETPYYLINNGNTPQTITLTSDTTGSTATPTVAYYLDKDDDGILSETERSAGAVSQINLPYDDPATAVDEGSVAFIQVLTSPTTAPAGSVSAASPVASGQGFDASTSAVINKQTESTAVLGLQFAAITTLTPSVTNNANTPSTPLTTTVTTPGGTSAVPGYTSGTTAIAINGDQQAAYPKISAAASDSVTFTNTVNNAGTLEDPVNLFPTDSSGNPIGTMQPGGTFTNVPGLPDGTTVQFLDMSGNPLPIGKDGLPVLKAAAGQKTSYQTKITYANVTDPTTITVVVGMDSGLDAGTLSNDTTTNVIYPPAAQFGDASKGLGTVSTPEPIQSGKPGETVYFPMDVANQGEYADTFTLSGTVQIPVTSSATPATVRVVYYPWTDSNDNGVVDAGEVGTTAITAPLAVPTNAEVKVVAAVLIPADAAATVAGSEPKVQQTATGQYSTIVMTDTNDKVNVTPSGKLAVAKFIKGGDEKSLSTHDGLTAPAGYSTSPNAALPGATLSYVIMAKNNYNVGIVNFTLTDTVPANTTYGESSCTLSTGGTCKTVKNNDTIYTDFNGDGKVTAADVLPQGATVTLNLSVTVK